MIEEEEAIDVVTPQCFDHAASIEDLAGVGQKMNG